jgi:hypothetical protein
LRGRRERHVRRERYGCREGYAGVTWRRRERWALGDGRNVSTMAMSTEDAWTTRLAAKTGSSGVAWANSQVSERT